MAFRSHSLSGPRQNRSREAVDSGGGSSHHYVESHPTTLNPSLALPKFSSAVSSSRFQSSRTGNKGMTESAEKRNQAKVANEQPPQHNIFTSIPTVGSSITETRSEESRNPPMEHRQVRAGGGGRLGGKDSYDDFSAKVREEMRKVQAEIHGGRRGGVSHPLRPLSHHQPSGLPPPRVGLSGPQQDPSAVQNSRERNKSGHIYNDSKVTQVNHQHEIENNDKEKRDGRNEQVKVLLERNKMLEQDLATKDREIVALHSERLGGEYDHRHVKGENQRLEVRNKDLEQTLSKKDSEIRELTRQLHSLKEAASEKDLFASNKDKLAQDYAKDLKALRSECEQALEEAVKENDALQKDQKKAAKENDALQKDQVKAAKENDRLRKDLDMLKKDLEELTSVRGENGVLNRDLSSVQGENSVLQKDLALVRGENDALRMDLRSAQKDLTSAEGEIDVLQKDLAMAQEENDVLRDNLRTTRGETIVLQEDLNSTQGETNGLRKDLEIAQGEIDVLQKELASSHGVIDELQDQSNENRVLRNDNEMLRNENEKLKEMQNTAQEDVELRQRAIKELEADYVSLMKEKNRLDSVADDLSRLEAEYETLAKAKMELEPASQELKKMDAKYEEILNENKRLETMIADRKENYHHLLEEKIRMERANQELKDELRCTREDYDVVKDRLLLLDEMTDALEVSLDEKQAAIAEKGDVVVRYNTLQDDYTALQNAIGRERESMDYELESTRKSTAYELESTKKSMAYELESTKKSMAYELESTKKSMTQELNAALARKEEAIDQFKELAKEHDGLKEELIVRNKELTKLQSTKGSSAHVTEMVTRQRDKLNGMVEKYQDEIEELKRANRDLRGQRDDLKEELICVLETASVYQD